jgi:hypothetical protein
MGWEDTSAGRRLRWRPITAAAESNELTDDLTTWIREQRRLKVRVPTIQRVAKQLFGVEVTEAAVRRIRA